MKLTRAGIKDRTAWEKAGITLPGYDVEAVSEKAKKELSSAMNANINLPFIAMTKSGPHHMDINITRSLFESMTADLIDRTVTPVENALHDAGLKKTDINMVLLVGGSTRIPAVQELSLIHI